MYSRKAEAGEKKIIYAARNRKMRVPQRIFQTRVERMCLMFRMISISIRTMPKKKIRVPMFRRVCARASEGRIRQISWNMS